MGSNRQKKMDPIIITHRAQRVSVCVYVYICVSSLACTDAWKAIICKSLSLNLALAALTVWPSGSRDPSVSGPLHSWYFTL